MVTRKSHIDEELFSSFVFCFVICLTTVMSFWECRLFKCRNPIKSWHSHFRYHSLVCSGTIFIIIIICTQAVLTTMVCDGSRTVPQTLNIFIILILQILLSERSWSILEFPDHTISLHVSSTNGSIIIGKTEFDC